MNFIQKLASSLEEVPAENRIDRACASILGAFLVGEAKPDQLIAMDSKLSSSGLIGSGSLISRFRDISENIPTNDPDMEEYSQRYL